MRRFVVLFAGAALALCATARVLDAPVPEQDVTAVEQAAAAQQEIYRKAAQARHAVLAQLPSARDRALALLQAQPFVPVRAAVLRHAADAAPEDLLLQCLAVQLPAEPGDSCSTGAPDPILAERVLALEFDNAAAHFPRLLLALEADDDLAVDSSLAAMAAAPRFDSHLFDLIEASVQLWRRFPQPAGELPWNEGPDGDPEAVFIGQSLMQAVFALPSYRPLVDACDVARADVSADLRRYAVCGDVGRLMSRSAAWIDRSFGYVVLEKSAQMDAQDQLAQQEYEALRSRFAQSVDADPVAAAAFLRAVMQLRDETAAAELVLAALAREAERR